MLLEVTCGSTRNPIVKVILNYKGKEIEKSNSGNGPVDSIFNCINALIKNNAKLELFLINAIMMAIVSIFIIFLPIQGNQRTAIQD